VVRIGGVSRAVASSDNGNRSFVPSSYLQPLLALDSPSVLSHLRWMLAKDNLAQDMFLLGSPSPLKRRLALAYCEMTNRDYELVTLSADTTESDLKQRREISSSKTSLLLNQPPVRAALNGSVLILDGIQYAERNVLPLLNNLLENREMNLEDGRLLVSMQRYKELTEANPGMGSSLVPVHEDFRIIALGHPTPPYAGNSLDPPLRSRFQSRRVDFLSPHTELSETLPDSPLPAKLSSLCAALDTITETSLTQSSLSLPTFPSTLLPSLTTTTLSFPKTTISTLLPNIYPFACPNMPVGSLTESQKQARTSFDLARERLGLNSKDEKDKYEYKLTNVESKLDGDRAATLTFHDGTTITTPRGPLKPVFPTLTDYSSPSLTRMLQAHHSGSDVMLLSPPGTAKSHLTNLFSLVLGYESNLFSLYKDMSTRDLLAIRGTDSSGETTYDYSPLITAALEGNICVLDGVDKLSQHSLQTLQQLTVDRELTLPDSTRLLRQDRYDLLADKTNVKPIHPSFRVVALANLPASAKQAKLLEDDVLAMFQTLIVPAPSSAEIEEIVKTKYPKLSDSVLTRIMLFHSALDAEKAASLSVTTLSLRNILRIASKARTTPLRDAIRSVLMADLLPQTQQTILEELLDQCAIDAPKKSSTKSPSTHSSKFIAFTPASPPNSNPDPSLIPSPLFYDIPQHVATINSIISDMNNDERSVLLIGNQGVGKNKIADRILELCSIEREYIQLHRDSTVGQLTLSPSLVDGRVVWEDSPLVRAVTSGRCLMIDEADKAPLEVVAVLKSLVEDGEMRLADGRRIVSPERYNPDDKNTISIHPNFRMFVLANRPGFPFLGNDFFREIGDCFASHAIPNPDLESEKSLLAAYGPNVSPTVIHKLATSFSELRKLSDSGDITYPYSTREAVAAVKHINAYPEDGMVEALMNVLHFDTFDDNLYTQLAAVFNTAGIPLPRSRAALRSGKTGSSNVMIDVAMPFPLPEPVQSKWPFAPSASSKSSPRSSDFHFLEPRRWDMPTPAPVQFAPDEHRIESFTHLVRSWNVHCNGGSYYSKAKNITALDSGGGAAPSIHVLTTSPITLHNFYDTINSSNGSPPTKQSIDFDSELPYYLPTNPPPVLCPLPKQNRLLAFFPSASMFLTMDPRTGKGVYVKLPEAEGAGGFSIFGGKSKKKQSSNDWRACEDLVDENKVLLYQEGGNDVCLLEFDNQNGVGCRWLNARDEEGGEGDGIAMISCANGNEFYARTASGAVRRIELAGEESFGGPLQYDVSGHQVEGGSFLHFAGNTPPPHLTEFTGARALVGDDIEYATRVQNDGDLFVTQRETPPLKVLDAAFHRDSKYFASLREDNQIEVIDSVKNEKRTINAAPSKKEKKDEFDFDEEDGVVTSNIQMKALTKDHVATLTSKGEVQIYEISEESMAAELESFREMLGLPKHAVPGGEGMKALTLNYESIRDGSEGESWNPPALDMPKFGEWDDKNEAHVGGSNWAGGTGGSNTAGLGGRGGPYRLDRGHKIHQVSDEAKAEVSEEAKKVAREMAEKGLKDKLKEIDMSEGEFAMYQGLADPIKSDIANLRNTLANAESKKAERSWLKKQSHGELDDSKLVDGIVGEKHVFKRRGVPPPEAGGNIKTPKRIRFVFDCSGSMYRFNGQDGRLDRSLEAAALVMESFHGYDGQFDYSIVGHSGDSPVIEFSQFGKPPKTERERMNILKKMVAHTQFCQSGDYTLEGIARAKQDVVAGCDDADEYIVIAISDANMRRYGISGRMVGQVVDSKMGLEQDVKTKVIFLASLGDEAEEIKKNVGSGKAFIAQNTSALPRIMREILLNL
jgi:MoxR-like ATPase